MGSVAGGRVAVPPPLGATRGARLRLVRPARRGGAARRTRSGCVRGSGSFGALAFIPGSLTTGRRTHRCAEHHGETQCHCTIRSDLHAATSRKDRPCFVSASGAVGPSRIGASTRASAPWGVLCARVCVPYVSATPLPCAHAEVDQRIQLLRELEREALLNQLANGHPTGFRGAVARGQQCSLHRVHEGLTWRGDHDERARLHPTIRADDEP